MQDLESYMRDGADANVRAILCLIQAMDGHFIESSWDVKISDYKGKLRVGRWENGREQGYVMTCVHPLTVQQFNIAIFNHRSSDMIFGLEWESSITMNSPTLADVPETHGYTNSSTNVDRSFIYNAHYECAEWVKEAFDEWWTEQDDAAKTG
ncbi:hypothetical protein CL653_03635 [bacterium]|nr:hypothetical protein [bacterium]|tara:strand:- start:2202 stop:2657 length:456 start_codon:yes stop_codon:yes gene_type:complete